VSCSTPEPPVCTSFVVMNCLPKQIACGAGQACPSGWSCFDYSNLDGTVPGWIADESRKSCMPDGLILAVEGHAAGGGAGGATGGSESAGVLGGDKGAVATTLRGDAGLTGDTSADTSTGVGVGPTAPSSGKPTTSGSDAGGTQEGTGTTAVKANGGGCTLGGGHPASSSLWLALALAGLVVRITRRRPAARP
jgi:MYXO-CTERM domain-containing protein